MAPIDVAAALAEQAPEEIEPIAQRYAHEALEVLVKQLTHGASEAATVAAATTILDRAYGRPVVDAAGTLTLPFLGSAPSRTVATEIRNLARGYSSLAIVALQRIATQGHSESVRVSAARGLLDRGLGTAPPAKVDASKREQAGLAAKAPAAEGSAWGDDLKPRRVH
jgi:phage gp46-like protein